MLKFFFRRIILQNFMFSSRFMLFPTFPTFKKTKILVYKKISGRGGGGVEIFFLLEE